MTDLSKELGDTPDADVITYIIKREADPGGVVARRALARARKFHGKRCTWQHVWDEYNEYLGQR